MLPPNNWVSFIAILPARKGDYYLSAPLGSGVYTGADPNTGKPATLAVNLDGRTVTVNEQGWPAETYPILESNWNVQTLGVYQSTTFTYTAGDLQNSGGLLEDAATNDAWLQTRQGSTKADSYCLTYDGAAGSGLNPE